MLSNWVKRGNPDPLHSPFISPFPITKPSEMSWTTKSPKRLVISTQVSSSDSNLLLIYCSYSSLSTARNALGHLCFYLLSLFLEKTIVTFNTKFLFFLKNPNLLSLSSLNQRREVPEVTKGFEGFFSFFFSSLLSWMRLGLRIWNTIFDYLFINAHIFIYFFLLS